ncbi:hypothetical protein CVT24_006038 [Panaeolus cyanescens]|uniref:Uncharacterized protein n=1 Tax=Panaeolus cyanescens TaxID=181874 RepID=A0A409YDY3_9AGAR|nr:hypothetical protein CVT24_006038 [Panaeolus cyanescens]
MEPQVSGDRQVTHKEVHRNCTTVTVPPLFTGIPRPSATSSLIPRDFVPWLNTRNTCVLITSKAWNGQEAIVQSGVRQGEKKYLTVRLETYNPHMPFSNINVEYDDVVEACSKLKLKEYSLNRHIYVQARPADVIICSHKQLFSDILVIHLPLHFHPQLSTNNKIFRRSAAWNPNSATPTWESDSNTPACSTSLRSAPEPSPEEHELLNRSLPGARFKVTVHGGGYRGSQMCGRVAEEPDRKLG